MRTRWKTKVEGLPELKKSFAEMPEVVLVGVHDALTIITQLILNKANAKILKGSKSGRIYKRRGVKHQSSAPGEAPASDTGKLVGSGETDVVAGKNGKAYGLVGYSAKYARWLEIGTRFLKPRPFLFPTLDEVRDRVREIFIKSVQARIKKVTGK